MYMQHQNLVQVILQARVVAILVKKILHLLRSIVAQVVLKKITVATLINIVVAQNRTLEFLVPSQVLLQAQEV